MKILTTVLLLLSITFSAQNHRFIYEYTFVKDSLEKDETISENMYLDITEKGSKYFSYEVFKRDSTMQVQLQKHVTSSGSYTAFASFGGKGTISTVIEKDYPTFDVLQYENIGSDAYRLKDERKINWKISNEKIKIGEFMAQKATTEMYGRMWIAWFATDLPFQDGPYKFHGLPGLIVKVEDVTQSHIIELKGVKKLPNDFALPEKKDMFSGNTITLNYPKFKKVFVENRNNPSSSMRQLQGSSTKFVMKDQDGKEIDFNKMMREQDEKAKEANKKNNNLLELDLLK